MLEEPNSRSAIPTSIGKKVVNRGLEQNVGECLAEEPKAARRASLTFSEDSTSKIGDLIPSELKPSLPTHFAGILVYWDLRTFMQQQYKGTLSLKFPPPRPVVRHGPCMRSVRFRHIPYALELRDFEDL